MGGWLAPLSLEREALGGAFEDEGPASAVGAGSPPGQVTSALEVRVEGQPGGQGSVCLWPHPRAASTWVQGTNLGLCVFRETPVFQEPLWAARAQMWREARRFLSRGSCRPLRRARPPPLLCCSPSSPGHAAETWPLSATCIVPLGQRWFPVHGHERHTGGQEAGARDRRGCSESGRAALGGVCRLRLRRLLARSVRLGRTGTWVRSRGNTAGG